MSDLISRSDAIEALLKEADKDGAYGYVDAKSIDEVLSALPSADAVSRDVYDKRTQADERIIDSYRREFSVVVSSEATCATCADRAMCIMSEPDGKWKACKDYRRSEAVQGEWKRVPTRTYKGECTNCGFRHIFMDGHDSQYRFCPYCGARMKGGGSE